MENEIVLKNPFAGFNANLMKDEEIIKYWIKPKLLFGRQALRIDITGVNPVVLEGGRGTGKTMILKYMSNDVRIKDYLHKKRTGAGFLKSISYLGVYHRFDGPSLGTFSGRNIPDEAWETIFKHYWELTFGQKFVMMLKRLKFNKCIKLNSRSEQELILETIKLIDPKKSPKLEKWTFEELVEYFQSKIDSVFEFINSSALSNKVNFDEYFLNSGRLVFGLPQISQKHISELEDKNIIILLDEYENLNQYQQRIVNTLVKHTKLPVTFRIGMRLRGFKTYDTLNKGEFLMEDADYRKIRFEDVLNAKDKTYRNLLKNIAKKRLELIPEFSKWEILDIEQLLGELKPEQEALLVVYNKIPTTEEIDSYPTNQYVQKSKHILEIKNLLVYSKRFSEQDIKDFVFKQNPLIEMLNLLLLRRGYDPKKIIRMFKCYINHETKSEDFKKYKYLYDKNKVNLLFQLVSLNKPTQKQYAGFNMYCMLSSGIIRSFLELCYQSFNIALFSSSRLLLEKKEVPFQAQTDGANIRSERYMEGIERIPEYGNEIKSLVRCLGAIFKSWQDDEMISEPEVTYFCVDFTSLSKRAKKVIDAAVQWSVFQPKKPMKGKSPSDPLLDVYALNHILAPYFGISYRLRGRIPQFWKKDIESLMFGNEVEKSETTARLGKNPVLGRRPTILDFIKGE